LLFVWAKTCPDLKNRSGFGEEPCDFSMYMTCLARADKKDAEVRGEKESYDDE